MNRIVEPVNETDRTITNNGMADQAKACQQQGRERRTISWRHASACTCSSCRAPNPRIPHSARP
jgi:hypothetical protein